MVAPTDTAAPEVGNAAPQTTQPVEAPPDQSAEIAPESATIAAPETVEAPSLPDLAGFSDDQLREHPAFKSLLSREQESARRRHEDEQSAALRTQRVQFMQSKGYSEQVKAAARNENGALVFDEEALEKAADDFYAGSQTYHMADLNTVVNERLGDYRVTPEEMRKFTEASKRFDQNPTKTAEFAGVLFEIAEAAAVERAKPELRKEIEREVRHEFEQAAEAERRRQAGETRNGNSGPTRGLSGSPATSWSTQLEIDIAHVNGDLTTAQLRALRNSGEYGRLPYQ